MQADAVAVRRAYELGRLRVSLVRASFVVVPVAVLAMVTGASLAWIPITLAVWIFANWRGGALLRGSYIGLVGGLATVAMPMTFLRPCCSPEAMKAGLDCCTQPSACITAGALLGVVLAAFLPSDHTRVRTAMGVGLGVASVAILRCSTLFAAEAFGLAGGLVGGVLVAAIGRQVLLARR